MYGYYTSFYMYMYDMRTCSMNMYMYTCPKTVHVFCIRGYTCTCISTCI